MKAEFQNACLCTTAIVLMKKRGVFDPIQVGSKRPLGFFFNWELGLRQFVWPVR